MRRVARYLLPLLMLALLLGGEARSQSSGDYKNFPVPFGPNNAGRDFWLAFPANWDNPAAAQYYIRLYITSGVRTQVRVWAGPGIKKVFYTKPYDIVTVDLTPIEAQMFTRNDRAPIPDDQIYRKKAIHIEAGAPIVVYGMNRTSFTSDGILALPVNALGREYIAASYGAVIGITQELPSQFMIVAPYNNTQVTIDQPMETPNHSAGERVSIQLDSGDVYSAMTRGYGGDMSGAVIRASKPVAVIAGQSCTYIPNQINYCCCDHITEMMLPVSSWGKFYQGVPFQTRLRGDFWRVFAGHPNTTIFINGVKYATLNQVGGEEGTGWLEYRATGKELVEFTADKPIYVAQYNTSQAYDGVPSDPFFLVLTPLEQYQSRLTFSTPSDDFPQNYINLVADSATYKQIEIAPGGTNNWQEVWKMPGAGVTKTFPTKINGRTYFGVVLEIKPGTYQMRGPVPFAGYIYGFSAYDSYGYPLSVATGDLSRPDTVAPPIVRKMDCDGNVEASTYDMPEDGNIRTNLATIELDPDTASTYNYELIVTPFEVGVSQSTTYKLRVLNTRIPAQAVVVISDMAGNVTLDTVSYHPFNVTIVPDPLFFGNLIEGETKVMRAKLMNLADHAVDLKKVQLKDGKLGFTLLNPKGKVTLQAAGTPGSEIDVEIEFTAKVAGSFQDSIGVEDSCGLRYITMVTSSVGRPVIEVTDKDFGRLVVGTSSAVWMMDVTNATKQGGLLRVTGASGPTDGAIFTLPNGLPAFPFDLRPGESKQIAVVFKPTNTQDYLDQIVFSSNAPPGPGNDSIGLLRGKGIKASLVATSYDWTPTWGRIRVNTQAPDEIVHLINMGTAPVDVNGITLLGDVNDFQVMNEGQIEGRRINPGDSVTVNVRFNPTAVGPRQMRVLYQANPAQDDSVISILDGIGIQPQLATQDYNFGSMTVGDPSFSQKVHFWLPLGSAWRDTVTITGFRFRTDQNGGVNDYISVPLDTALQLIPGVRDTVEFTGTFQAQAAGVRTAELEALTADGVNVTSHWTGNATVLAAGITGTGGTATAICIGQTTDIIATIENNGAIDLTIDSLRLSGGEFEVIDPEPNTPFVLRKGETQNVTIRFTPTTKGIQNTQLYVYNSTGTRLDLQIGASSLDEVVNSTLVLTGTKGLNVELGKDMGASISLATLPAGVTVTNYVVRISYDAQQLVPRPELMKLGPANPAGGGATVNPSSTRGRLVIDVALPGPLTGPGELLSIPFGVLFTTIPDRSLTVEVSPAGTTCMTVLGSADTIGVEAICGLNLRLIELTSADYTLDQNKPNPFNPMTVIRYSLGLDGPTQIFLYDANGKMVQKLVDEYQKPGTYELTLDVTNLPSGNYYYKLVSGTWSQTRMLTVIK